ncbi:beta-galactosidase [Capsulimonas corticalis]|uniref:Beta-galactosidase n=1 Tax=Capsulimonas corticalis TaxID=2219043 RepID=A0A402D375_9BACT|nr:beta-galactosidase [Capsulimonas corticalis]BDI28473.1 beta-galactosidase [Capsulimonas corticalis]
MNIKTLGLAACALLSGAALFPTLAHANDGIFPSATKAKQAIDFDGRGFLINGKRTFIASAGMEYARVPRALWRDRLLRFKRAGMNCVEVYNFWDFHEPQEGKFNFSGDADLDAFFKLVHSLGMYAIARVGPYYCAEWDNGGYPVWLRNKPGVRVREDSPEFEKYVDRYFDKLIPIVAANQINRGGCVVLVQLENEHPQGWGTEMPNAYFRHLQSKALALGLEVPYFFSGLHHGSDPAGDVGHSWDSVGRTNPWMTTEFWSIWYDRYGQSLDAANEYDRRTMKILAYGGNGYNYYMMHGGTNFAYWNNDEDAASYDYGAAVGQGGDLRSIYYRNKRAAWFARSFQSILEDSTNADADFSAAASDPAVKVTARRSPAGTLVFLDNPGKSPVQTSVGGPNGSAEMGIGSVTLEPGEIAGFVRDYQIAPGVTITRTSSRIMGIFDQDGVTTMVIHGEPGSMGQVLMKTNSQAAIAAGASDFKSSGNTLTLDAKFPQSGVDEYTFAAGATHVRILAVGTARADRTWFVEAGGKNYIVSGPEYISDAAIQNGRLRLTYEKPWIPIPEAEPSLETVIYSSGDAPQRFPANDYQAKRKTTLEVSQWETKSGSDEAAVNYDDHGWLASAAPSQMGADNDITADAWYRSAIPVPKTGDYTIKIDSAQDRWLPFVDGAPAGPKFVHGNSVNVHLTAGTHAFAAFTAHDGRQKMPGYVGLIESSAPKGLFGAASLTQQAGEDIALTPWRVLKSDDHTAPPASDAAGWSAYAIGQDPFGGQSGFVWLQTTLPDTAPNLKSHSVLFPTVDDNATVFLNGQKLTTHEGWNEQFNVSLDSAWRAGGPNILSVLVENTAGAGGMSAAPSLSSVIFSQPITGWKLRGGPGDPFDAKGWTAFQKAEANGPRFYRAKISAPGGVAPGQVWRVLTHGLSHGSVWVNGQNLGRYPEKIPIEGMYIPPVWLKPGDNSLVIYDESGNAPDQVEVQVEAAASRDLLTIEAKG